MRIIYIMIGIMLTVIASAIIKTVRSANRFLDNMERKKEKQKKQIDELINSCYDEDNAFFDWTLFEKNAGLFTGSNYYQVPIYLAEKLFEISLDQMAFLNSVLLKHNNEQTLEGLQDELKQCDNAIINLVVMNGGGDPRKAKRYAVLFREGLLSLMRKDVVTVFDVKKVMRIYGYWFFQPSMKKTVQPSDKIYTYFT